MEVFVFAFAVVAVTTVVITDVKPVVEETFESSEGGESIATAAAAIDELLVEFIGREKVPGAEDTKAIMNNTSRIL